MTSPDGSPGSGAPVETCLPSWHELEALAKHHGDGFWLLDLDRFRANAADFRDAFVTAGWPDTQLAWSFKTLWAPPVVRASIEMGGLAEVVSAVEYDLALALGIDPELIVVNGPLKTVADLSRATALGSRIHLDGPDEVADLLALADRHPGRRFRVGLRVNLDLGLPQRSRFGLDSGSNDLRAAFAELSAHPRVEVDGLQVHLGGARAPELYTHRAERLVDLADDLWAVGSGPAHLDLGGGFTGTIPEALWRQLGYAPWTPAAYAKAIVPVLRRRWPAGGPALLLEPGMALAADAMRFAARVGATKIIAGVHHAIVGASVYAVKPTLHRFDLPLHAIRRDGRPVPAGHTMVSGWTCMEGDILARDCGLELARGDWVVLDNCGAYTFVLSSRFVRGTPAIIQRKGDDWHTVRRADTAADWLATFEERG